MQQQLISHSPDLRRLLEEGFHIETRGGHLLVHHVPYVTPAKSVKYGVLVCPLTYATPSRVGAPPDHTIRFIGEIPCEFNGNRYAAIINNSRTQTLASGIVINHTFSSKPKSGSYADYYEKVKTYVEILCSQARVLVPSATAVKQQKEVENGK